MKLNGLSHSFVTRIGNHAARIQRRLARAGLGRRFRGAIDFPAEMDSVPRDAVRLTGWALCGAEAPDEVHVVINGCEQFRARIGRPRADVPENLGEPDTSADCGWSCDISLSPFQPGTLIIEAIAVHNRRRSVVGQRSLKLQPHSLIGRIDSPSEGAALSNGLLAVSGWAYSKEGLALVEVEMDGIPLGRARIRRPRPDVAALYPGNSLLSGFDLRHPVDDESDGSRTISVFATDFKGQRRLLQSVSCRCVRSQLSDTETRHAERLQRLNEAALSPILRQKDAVAPSLLIFTHTLSLGGGQLYLQELMRKVLPSTKQCTVVSPESGPLAEELESLGADVVISGHSTPLDIITYEGQIRGLQQIIAASACDVVILNTIGCFVAADAANRSGVPTIWAIHESCHLSDWIDQVAQGRPYSPYIAMRIRHALAHSSALIFEARATLGMYQRHAAQNVCRVVPYGVDTAALEVFATSFDQRKSRRMNGIRDDAVVILCAGIFEERKSQAALLDAFLAIRDSHPEAMLVLVGDNGSEYAQTLHSIVKKYDVQGRVRIVPVTKNIWEWYAVSDFLVSASDLESMPRSMLEAMALRCAVLATSVYGVPELIEDGVTGWLMPPRDMKALIAGLDRVLNLSLSERAAVADRARELILREHDSNGYAADYLGMIAELRSQYQFAR
jgi:D-inositol-3-phosphate glycosyltransferase